MVTRKSEAEWTGDLKTGRGTIELESGAFRGGYSFDTRFAGERGTNPEELVAGAHAACFSMALAHDLSQAGFEVKKISTVAKVHLEKTADGFVIPKIDLETRAEVPEISSEDFRDRAEKVKSSCPISKLLSGAQIMLDAELTSSMPEQIEQRARTPVSTTSGSAGAR